MSLTLNLSQESAPALELSCPSTQMEIMGVILRQPTVIPVCWLAGFIGLVGFFQIRKANVVGSS